MFVQGFIVCVSVCVCVSGLSRVVECSLEESKETLNCACVGHCE